MSVRECVCVCARKGEGQIVCVCAHFYVSFICTCLSFN
jgi:hypothetical protein